MRTLANRPSESVSAGPIGLLAPARILWLVVVVTALGVFVAGLPHAYAQLATACAPDGRCLGGREVTTVGAARLARLGLDLGMYATARTAIGVLGAGVYLATGAVIAWRRHDDRIALLVSGVLIVFATMLVGSADALAVDHPAMAPIAVALGMYGFAAFFVLFYLFPDGRFVPRWTLPLTVLWAVGISLTTLAPGLPILRGINASGAPLLALAGTAVVAQVYRHRRVSRPSERQQTKWVVLAMAVALVGLIVVPTVWFTTDIVAVEGGTDRPVAYLLTLAVLFALLTLIPVGFAVAILRHQLFDIDLVLNRTLVFMTLTAVVAAVYIAVVGGLGVLLRSQADLPRSVVAAGVVAALFAPVRARVQRGVNRLVYGDRDDPYAVIARLGQRLEASLAPAAVLPSVVTTVADALKAAHVAIEVVWDATFVTEASTGVPAGESLKVPLVHGGATVGRLVLSPRPGSAGFSTSDRRLLDGIVPQVGVAVHAEQLRARALRLSTDLQRSRERLVTAREEERRRLRRDLHDGLGPQLAAITMRAEAARELLPTDPGLADETLAGLTGQAQAAVADVRRLVYGLRPPALDTLGLMDALRSHAAHHDYGHLSVDVQGQSQPLPAAVEVAAYRIALEALTNAARHADADHATLRLRTEGATLVVEVTDDGRGLSDSPHTGVGLASMRERAAELGGVCTIDDHPDGGVRVRATLPWTTDGGGG